MTGERAKRFPLGLADLERKPRAAADGRVRPDERVRTREPLSTRESAVRRIDTHPSHTGDKMGAPNVPLTSALALTSERVRERMVERLRANGIADARASTRPRW